MSSIGTETYATSNIISPTISISNAPDFSTDLSSTNPLISTISFTVQSSINGYTIVCEDAGGDSESCTIDILGNQPPINCNNNYILYL